MIRFVFSCILAAFMAINVHAQHQRGFNFWKKYVKKTYDIAVKIPHGYICENSNGPILFFCMGDRQWGKDSRRKKLIATYYVIAASIDGNSKIFYPDVDLSYRLCDWEWKQKGRSLSEYITMKYKSELHNVVYDGFLLGETLKEQPEWASYVRKIEGDEALRWNNSDVIYIVDLPVTETYEAKYNHCIGLYMMQETHTPVFLKLLLTDEGYANRDVLVKKAAQSMKFGKSSWQFNETVKRAEQDKFRNATSGLFPKKPSIEIEQIDDGNPKYIR